MEEHETGDRIVASAGDARIEAPAISRPELDARFELVQSKLGEIEKRLVLRIWLVSLAALLGAAAPDVLIRKESSSSAAIAETIAELVGRFV